MMYPGRLKTAAKVEPSKDARRGRCHPLEAGFWPLWMTPLPESSNFESPKSKDARRASVLFFGKKKHKK